MNPGKYIATKADYPSGPHFAIVEFKSIYIEGDERSRTNPGHGYPAHTEAACEYIAFEDRASWLKAVSERALDATKYHASPNWVAFEVKSVARVESRVVVDAG